MSKNPSDRRVRPGKRTAEHTEQQRARILKAAKEAYVEFGFHEASMSMIAKKAGVSQGLAYCYFDSKDTIFEAIVSQDVKEFWDKYRTIGTKQDFIDKTIECFRTLYAPVGTISDAVLYLELRAEAARNKRIADCVRAVDSAGLDIDRRILRLIYEGEHRAISDEAIENKVMLIDTLIDGVVTQMARDQRVIDPERYLGVIRKGLEVIIEG